MNGERPSVDGSPPRSGRPRTRYVRYYVSVADGADGSSSSGRVQYDVRYPQHYERSMVTEAEWRLFALTVSVGLATTGISVSLWAWLIR